MSFESYLRYLVVLSSHLFGNVLVPFYGYPKKAPKNSSNMFSIFYGKAKGNSLQILILVTQILFCKCIHSKHTQYTNMLIKHSIQAWDTFTICIHSKIHSVDT